MACDRSHSCLECPELRAYSDKRGPLVMQTFLCPIAMQGKPTDPVRAVS